MVETELDLQRLLKLREALGSEGDEIAQTLRDLMSAAVSAIDTGLIDDDLRTVALAAHAARNSALLIDAQPVLGHLEELECRARAGEREATLAAREQLRSSWAQLHARLTRIASETSD